MSLWSKVKKGAKFAFASNPVGGSALGAYHLAQGDYGQAAVDLSNGASFGAPTVGAAALNHFAGGDSGFTSAAKTAANKASADAANPQGQAGPPPPSFAAGPGVHAPGSVFSDLGDYSNVYDNLQRPKVQPKQPKPELGQQAIDQLRVIGIG